MAPLGSSTLQKQARLLAPAGQDSFHRGDFTLPISLHCG